MLYCTIAVFIFARIFSTFARAVDYDAPKIELRLYVWKNLSSKYNDINIRHFWNQNEEVEEFDGTAKLPQKL